LAESERLRSLAALEAQRAAHVAGWFNLKPVLKA